MLVVSRKLGFGLVFAALCLSGQAAHAQAAPVQYLSAPFSSGESLAVNARNFQGIEGSDLRGGVSRYNFSDGWFVGSERSGAGWTMNGINPSAGFGNFGLRSEGVQFGYNFKDANGSSPMTLYAGFDTLKSSNGNPFASFDSQPGTLPGYGAHAGVEFRPTSNLSLSLGVGYTQLPSRGDINSQLLSGVANHP